MNSDIRVHGVGLGVKILDITEFLLSFMESFVYHLGLTFSDSGASGWGKGSKSRIS